MSATLRHIVLVLGLVLLAACGEPTIAEIIQKADKIESKADLEKRLGKPQEMSKLGPVETWVYKAKDGQVSFLITGDRVQMAAGGRR